MQNNEKILQEQEAPLKNNDNAYVQVGKNGEPVFPETVAGSKTENDEPKATPSEKE